MADGSITISITGDAKELEAELKKVNERIKQTGKNSEESGKQGSKLGSMISAGCKVAAAALAAVGAAAAGVAVASYKVGSEYETALAKVGTIADTAAKPLATLSDEIMNLSSQTGIAAADIAEATYSAISATGDTANAVSIVAQATQLATAGFASTGDSLNTLTGIMNAYGMQAQDLESVSDSLIATQNLGVLTIGELSSSIGRAISTASAYGVGLSNLETGYIALTKAGISCDESTTYLSSMFSELGDAGSNVGKILTEETGQSFGQLMESGYSLADVLQILYDNCGQDSEALMQLWGSQEAGKASNAIVSQGLQQFNDWLGQVEDSAGTTASAYEKMQATVSAQTDILKNNIKNLGIQLYNSFSPALVGAIEQVNAGISSLSDAFETGGIEGFTAQLGTLVAQAVSTLISAAPQMLSAAATIVSSLGAGIAQAAPQIMQAGMDLLNSLTNGIRQNLPQMIPAAMEALVRFSGSLRENVGQLVDAGLALVTALAQSLIANIPVFIETVPTIITNLAGIINDNAPKLLITGISLLGQLALGLIQAIPTLIANIPQIIQAIASVFSAFNWLSLGKNLVSAIGNGIKSMGGAAKAAAENIRTNIVNAIKNLPSTLSALGKNAINLLSNGIRGMAGAVRGAATNILNAIVNAIKSLPSKLLSIGKNAVSSMKSAFTSGGWSSVGRNIVNGIVSGVAGAAGRLLSKMRSLASSALSAAKRALGIASPSKLFAKMVGRWIPEGVAVGIEQNTRTSVNAATDMARKTVSSASLAAARLSLVADTHTAAANASTAYTTNHVYFNGSGANNITYNQTINSPKAMSRREVRRETKNTVKELKAYA